MRYAERAHSLLFGIFLLVAATLSAQHFDSACTQQKQVMGLLRHLHLQPPPDNSTTRSETTELFLSGADKKSIFFMQNDAEEMKRLSEEMNASDLYCHLISKSFFILRNRLSQLDSIAEVIAGRPLLLDGEDTINFIFVKSTIRYFNSLDELSKRIEKRIKYRTMLLLTRTNSLRSVDSAMPDSACVADARDMALQQFRRKIDKLREPRLLMDHLADCMSNAIAQRYDPHSNYLSTRNFLKYRNALSTHERSFGFTVGENQAGELIIEELVPGGPAWNSNILNEGDRIVTLSVGNEMPLQIMGLSAPEINEMLDGSTGELRLTVVKKDLQERCVALEKEIIRSEGNTLNSYVAELENKRIGLIPLPSFYLDQDSETRQGCANDVAREIIELKRDSVQGIILDLRYNGGGSMREAIGLAGIFIDEGPVAIYKQRGEAPFLLKDIHRGTIWDGPLLILVNSASASASEFLAATLQDYNRAVLAGSRTFGKGTAQDFVPADTAALSGTYVPTRSSGFLKITAGKFYRLTSHSHQGTGISPDIPIPGVMEKILHRESTYPFALPADTAGKIVSYKVLAPLPLEQLRKKSRARIAASPRFRQVISLGDSLQRVSTLTERLALSIQDFSSYLERQKTTGKQMSLLSSASGTAPLFRHNSASEAIIALDPFQRRHAEKTITVLRKDLALTEGIMIMNDLIDLQAKP